MGRLTMYQPKLSSYSEFINLRGLKHHVRIWGAETEQTLVLLHGWMDTSASFQFIIDELQQEWRIIALDWRGFGQSDWAPQGYWFPDYYADLDAFLDHYQLQNVNLIGHSMGGNVSGIYSGLRPERVRRYISLEGFGMPNQPANSAPKKLREWLDGWHKPPRLRGYDSFDELAKKLQRNNKRLSDEKAQWLALDWGMEKDGKIILRADPWHKSRNPVPYRSEEADACWAEITAPTLFVCGDESSFRPMFENEVFAERKKNFKQLSEERIADAGHMLHHDQPAKIAAIIENFVK